MRPSAEPYTHVLVALLAVLTTTLVGCAGNPDGTDATHAPTRTHVSRSAAPPRASATTTVLTQTPPRQGWTTGPVVRGRQVSVPPVPMLIGIRTAAHPGFDRIVFDFEGQLPGYEIRYVDRVIKEPSGEPATVPGRRFLRIRFEPTDAHDDTGRVTAPRAATVNLPMLRAYQVVGDFEAVVSVALGLDDTVGFRVGGLSNPNRIYLDVAA